MALKIENNFEGCAFGNPLYGETPLECYWSQVKDGAWHGPKKCFSASCLVLAHDYKVKCPHCGSIVLDKTNTPDDESGAFMCDNCGEWVQTFDYTADDYAEQRI